MTFGIEGLRLLAFTVVGLRLLEGVIVMRRRQTKSVINLIVRGRKSEAVIVGAEE